MPVLLEYTTTVETHPTDMPGVVKLTIRDTAAPDKDWTVYIDEKKVKKITDLETARRVAYDHGYLPLDLSKVDGDGRLTGALIEGPFSAADLIRDATSYDGCTYRYGQERPMNRPLHDSICAMCHDIDRLVPELEKHPQVTVGEPYHVRGNGTSYHVEIQLTDEQWQAAHDRVKGEQYFSISRMISQVIPSRYRVDILDPLGLADKVRYDDDTDNDDGW